jgi:hypothetical protein
MHVPYVYCSFMSIGHMCHFTTSAHIGHLHDSGRHELFHEENLYDRWRLKNHPLYLDVLQSLNLLQDGPAGSATNVIVGVDNETVQNLVLARAFAKQPFPKSRSARHSLLTKKFEMIKELVLPNQTLFNHFLAVLNAEESYAKMGKEGGVKKVAERNEVPLGILHPYTRDEKKRTTKEDLENNYGGRKKRKSSNISCTI